MLAVILESMLALTSVLTLQRAVLGLGSIVIGNMILAVRSVEAICALALLVNISNRAGEEGRVSWLGEKMRSIVAYIMYMAPEHFFCWHSLGLVALSSIDTEPIVPELGELVVAVSQRIAHLHFCPRPAVLALRTDEVSVLTVPLCVRAVAGVLGAAHVLDLDALAAVEAGEAGMLRAADLVLVLAGDAGVTLGLQLVRVHVAGAFAVLTVDVRLGEKGDGIGKGTEQVSVIGRTGVTYRPMMTFRRIAQTAGAFVGRRHEQ